MKRFEADYAAGAVDNDTVATALAVHLAGSTKEQLTASMDHTDFIDDAIEISQKLNQAGIKVLVATLTWRFVADWVAAQLNGEAISGVELEESSGIFTGKVKCHSYDDDKTKSLQRWCKARGITLQQCIAVGDSRSDLHIFDNVGLSLAINPSDAAKKSANYSGDFDALWQLFVGAPLGAA
jgi:phosphoserine phosphatase